MQKISKETYAAIQNLARLIKAKGKDHPDVIAEAERLRVRTGFPLKEKDRERGYTDSFPSFLLTRILARHWAI